MIGETESMKNDFQVQKRSVLQENISQGSAVWMPKLSRSYSSRTTPAFNLSLGELG